MTKTPSSQTSTTSAVTGIDLASCRDHTAVMLINPPTAWIDVLAERQRQVTGEGWTPEHDDAHNAGEMAGAALCYLAADIPHWAREQAIGCYWPWSREWWKPTDHRRDLVKAAALILAEIERLDRAALRHPDAAILHAEQQAEAAAEREGEDRADG